MREILFHGKTYKGEWIEGNFIDWGNHIQVYIFPLLDYATSYDLGTSIRMRAQAVIPETVGQLTGLCDKNGKRIFEGDIVKCRHEWRPNYKGIGEQYEPELAFMEREIKAAYGKHIEDGYWGKRYFYYRNYVVEFHRGYCGWRLRNGNVIHNIGNNTLFNHNAEIIGNIHDNPELLTAVGADQKESKGKRTFRFCLCEVNNKR